MVTVAEIEQKERELNEPESQARQIASEPIPQRRFGAGITPQIQQQQIQRRQQAQSTLMQISERRQVLSQAKAEVIAIEEERGRVQRQADEFALGRRLVLEGREVALIGERRQTVLEGARAGREELERAEVIKQQAQERLKQREIDAELKIQEKELPNINLQPKSAKQLIQESITGEEQISVIKDTNTINKIRKESFSESSRNIRTLPTLEEKFLALQLRAENIREEKGIKAKGERVFLGISTAIGGTLLFGKSLITKPIQTTKGIQQSIVSFVKSPIQKTESFVETQITSAKTDPFFFGGKVAGELIVLKGTSKLISGTGTGIQTARTITSPKFVPFKKIPQTSSIAGTIRNVATSKGKINIPTAKPVKQILEPLSKQVKLAGTKQTIVSAQTNLFGTIIKRKIVTERPLFFDPRGRLRVSRLNIQGKELSLLEVPKVVTGKIKLGFTKGRLQALVLPDEQIQGLPKSLGDVRTSLLKGRSLTESQQIRLTKFLEKPSGLIKPIGKLTKEPEVILPAGEIIERGKLVGVTLIKGRRVEIIEPVIRRTGETTGRILTETNIKQRVSNLIISSKEKPVRTLGSLSEAFSVSVVSRSIIGRPSQTSVSEISSQRLPSRKVIDFRNVSPISASSRPSRPISPASISRGISPSINIPVSPPSLPPSLISPRISPISKPIKPVAKISPPLPKIKTPRKTFKVQRLPRTRSLRTQTRVTSKGFRTFVIKGGKKVFVGGVKPKGKALKFGEEFTKGSLRATFGIEPANILTREKDIAFRPSKKIFRTFKIRKEKRIPLKDTFIQKTRKEGGLKGGRLSFKGELEELMGAKLNRLI